MSSNSDNIYYQLKDGFRGKLKLEVKKSDALIEFLFKFNGSDLVYFSGIVKMSLNSTNRFIYITVMTDFSKKIIFNLQTDKKLKYKLFMGYSLPLYSYYFPGNANEISSPSSYSNLSISP